MPVASLAATAVTRSSMRRCASEWAVGIAATKQRSFWVPKASCSLKATAISESWASRDSHPAGSTTAARLKRMTRKPGRPSFLLVKHPDNGEPVTSLRRAVCLREAHAAGCQERHRTSPRHKVGRRQGKTVAEAEGSQGVGGLHMSYDVGEREGTRTRPSKGGPC